MPIQHAARRLSVFVALSLLSIEGSAQQPGRTMARFPDPDRMTKLASAYGDVDKLFRDYATAQHIPGAAWGLIVDGKLVHIGVTGFRDIAANSPVDSNSVFRIASMTKSFTAVSILKLRDQGKLSLDDPAEKYVPELAALKYPTTDSPKITIRNLLSHSEGFPEDNPWGDQQLSQTDAQMTAMLREGIPFSNAPGMAYEYSNYGFAILGRIVSRVSGMPYKDYVAKEILGPLGMGSTTLEPASVAANRLAQGYRWEDDQWKLEPQLPDGAFGSMGGMLTSLHDLGTWVSQFLAAYPPRDGAETGPIKRSSLREMQTISRPRTPSVTRDASGSVALFAGGYAYGLRVSANCLFGQIVAHTGGLPGFGSLMMWLPDYGVGIIAFGNRTYSGWTGTADRAFARLAETGALQPREPVPAAALLSAKEAATRLVMKWDDRLADSLAAVNLFLDRSRDRRQADVASLLQKVGPCRAADSFDVVENALRGQWVMPCARGALRVSITLAPTMPPRVQFLDVAEQPRLIAAPPGRICAQ
jgi:CubicO group peptidase (beta-lactamase class C family)